MYIEMKKTGLDVSDLITLVQRRGGGNTGFPYKNFVCRCSNCLYSTKGTCALKECCCMEDMITMSMRTEGDTEKFEVEIRKISDQLCAMRSQLEVARSQTQSSEKVNQEIESIKAFLADTEINFSEYNEIVVRKLIECIRVMPDRKLVIVLKGGITIEEQIAE